MSEKRVIGTLGDLAAVPGVPSEPTLRKLIKENADFPIITTGTNGSAFEIDIAEAVAWLKAYEEKRREADRARREEVRQFALELLGDDAVASPGEGLTAADHKALLEAELFSIKVAERRGELIRKASVEEAVSSVLVIDAQRRATFSARLAKRIDLPRELIAAVDALMEFDRKAFAADLRKIAETADADAASTDEPGADPVV